MEEIKEVERKCSICLGPVDENNITTEKDWIYCYQCRDPKIKIDFVRNSKILTETCNPNIGPYVDNFDKASVKLFLIKSKHTLKPYYKYRFNIYNFDPNNSKIVSQCKKYEIRCSVNTERKEITSYLYMAVDTHDEWLKQRVREGAYHTGQNRGNSMSSLLTMFLGLSHSFEMESLQTDFSRFDKPSYSKNPYKRNKR